MLGIHLEIQYNTYFGILEYSLTGFLASNQ